MVAKDERIWGWRRPWVAVNRADAEPPRFGSAPAMDVGKRVCVNWCEEAVVRAE
jgi:hypothetical protein